MIWKMICQHFLFSEDINPNTWLERPVCCSSSFGYVVYSILGPTISCSSCFFPLNCLSDEQRKRKEHLVSTRTFPALKGNLEKFPRWFGGLLHLIWWCSKGAYYEISLNIVPLLSRGSSIPCTCQVTVLTWGGHIHLNMHWFPSSSHTCPAGHLYIPCTCQVDHCTYRGWTHPFKDALISFIVPHLSRGTSAPRKTMLVRTSCGWVILVFTCLLTGWNTIVKHRASFADNTYQEHDIAKI